MSTREELRAEVVAQRLEQGLDPEPSPEQLAFVGAVIASDLRARVTDNGALPTTNS